jgi:hypothetical protein
MGVDPQALRDQLDSADLTPPTPDQTDDLPKLRARLEGGDPVTVLTPSGDGYVFVHDGAVWTVRPAFPGGWELRAPNSHAVGWFDSPEDCVDHVTALPGDGAR